MMKKSAMFYGVVVAATLLLIGIAWYFQKLIQGFANPAIADTFQNLSPEQKKAVCDISNTNLCQHKESLMGKPADDPAYKSAYDQVLAEIKATGCEPPAC